MAKSGSTYFLSGRAINHERLKQPGLTLAALAGAVGVDTATVSRWISAKQPASVGNIMKLAQCLKMKDARELLHAKQRHDEPFPDLAPAIAAEAGITFEAEELPDGLTRVRFAAVFSARPKTPQEREAQGRAVAALFVALRGMLPPSANLAVVTIVGGSAIFACDKSAAAEAVILDAQTHNALAEYGVSQLALTDSSAPTPTEGAFSSTGRIQRCAPFFSAAALCFAFAGVAPVNALPWYGIGLILAAGGLAFSYVAGYRLVVPIIALVLNFVALLFWPNAVGLFDGPDGYSFTVGRRGDVPEQLNDVRGLKAHVFIAPLLAPFNWQDGERFEVIIDGKKVLRCSHLNGGATLHGLDANGRETRLNSPEFGGISFGTHLVTVTVNGKDVFSKQITIEPCDPNSSTISIEVGRDRARVYETGKRGHIEY